MSLFEQKLHAFCRIHGFTYKQNNGLFSYPIWIIFDSSENRLFVGEEWLIQQVIDMSYEQVYNSFVINKESNCNCDRCNCKD
jgi:hypothetical protein